MEERKGEKKKEKINNMPSFHQVI